MKTIIQVVQHLRPGGIEVIALDLLSFTQSNEKTIIISLEGELNAALQHWPKLSAFKDNLIFLNKQPGISPSLVFKLIKLFKKNNAVAVHTHHIGPLLYAGLAARAAGIQHLTHTEHDAWHLENKKRCYIQRTAVTLLQPTLVADAQTVANNMREKLNYRASIAVIHNGIDCAYFTPGDQRKARLQLQLPPYVHLIGCSGRMEVVKGQRVLINALCHLPQAVHVALAGAGTTEPDLRALVTKLGLDNRVHFLGHLDQMPTFYQALDIFCLPSLDEGFPLSPLEAQACDIKTLVTDVGASKETLCPHNGQKVAANDSASMASMLLKMMTQPINIPPRLFVEKYGNVHNMAKAYTDLRIASIRSQQ